MSAVGNHATFQESWAPHLFLFQRDQAELLFSFPDHSCPSIKGSHVFFPLQVFFTPLSCLLKKKHSVLIIILTHGAWISFFFISFLYFFVHWVSRDWLLILTLSSRALRLSLAESQHIRDRLKKLFTSIYERKGWKCCTKGCLSLDGRPAISPVLNLLYLSPTRKLKI